MSKQFMICALIGLSVSGSIRPEETRGATLPRISYLAKQVSHLVALWVAFIALTIIPLREDKREMGVFTVIIGTSATCALYDTHKKQELERELQECRLIIAESNMRTAED